MLCYKPIIITGIGEVGCGKCLHCGINRQRVWASRILLETLYNPPAVFVTLTYDDLRAVWDDRDRTILEKAHIRNYWKRVRKMLPDVDKRTFRYFVVGEYGDRTMRAHYHAAIFGLDYAHWDKLAYQWDYGFIKFDEMNPARAAYIAGYTVKKMTKADHVRLDGRPPEFARMSTGREAGQGAIGTSAVKALAAPYMTRKGAAAIAEYGDISTCWRHEGRIWPLGRYIANRIRKEVGIPETKNARYIAMHGEPPPLEIERHTPEELAEARARAMKTQRRIEEKRRAAAF